MPHKHCSVTVVIALCWFAGSLTVELRRARKDSQLVSKRLLLNDDEEEDGTMDTLASDQVLGPCITTTVRDEDSSQQPSREAHQLLIEYNRSYFLVFFLYLGGRVVQHSSPWQGLGEERSWPKSAEESPPQPLSPPHPYQVWRSCSLSLSFCVYISSHCIVLQRGIKMYLTRFFGQQPTQNTIYYYIFLKPLQDCWVPLGTAELM